MRHVVMYWRMSWDMWEKYYLLLLHSIHKETVNFPSITYIRPTDKHLRENYNEHRHKYEKDWQSVFWYRPVLFQTIHLAQASFEAFTTYFFRTKQNWKADGNQRFPFLPSSFCQLLRPTLHRLLITMAGFNTKQKPLLSILLVYVNDNGIAIN